MPDDRDLRGGRAPSRPPPARLRRARAPIGPAVPDRVGPPDRHGPGLGLDLAAARPLAATAPDPGPPAGGRGREAGGVPAGIEPRDGPRIRDRALPPHGG